MEHADRSGHRLRKNAARPSGIHALAVWRQALAGRLHRWILLAGAAHRPHAHRLPFTRMDTRSGAVVLFSPAHSPLAVADDAVSVTRGISDDLQIRQTLGGHAELLLDFLAGHPFEMVFGGEGLRVVLGVIDRYGEVEGIV